MFTLLALDRDIWWTMLGNGIKYGLLLLAVAIGFVLFRRSRIGYFGLGWLIVVVAPLAVISSAANALGSHAVFRQPGHEDIFKYGWLAIALAEFYLFWIPGVACMMPRREELSAAPTKSTALPAGVERPAAGAVELGERDGAMCYPAMLASATATAYVLFVVGSIALTCGSSSRCSLWHSYTALPTLATIVVGCGAAWGLWRRRRWAWWLAVGAVLVQCVRLGLRFAALGGVPIPVECWIAGGLLGTLLATLLAGSTRRSCSR